MFSGWSGRSELLGGRGFAVSLAVSPPIAVSLVVQAFLGFVQAKAPYKPRPEKYANWFNAVVTGAGPLATALGVALYPAAWTASWVTTGVTLGVLAVLPPISGLIAARVKGDDKLYDVDQRYLGHLVTDLGGAAGATGLLWMAQTIHGFDDFTESFSDKAALNCVLPMTMLTTFAFVRWQQVNECPDVDDLITRGQPWEDALTGYSLRHFHQRANLVFLMAATFTATTTVLYLFAFAMQQARTPAPLPFTPQIGVAMVLSLVFFYACGLKWSRGNRAVYLTFLTGTPAALGAVLVWLSFLEQGFARNAFAIAIAFGGYLAYAVEAILASRSAGEKLELYYFATSVFALVLAILAAALYLFPTKPACPGPGSAPPAAATKSAAGCGASHQEALP